jgi:hypothetical protein
METKNYSPRVIAGTNGTIAGVNALAASLERGRALITKSKRLITYSCLIQMRQNALWACEEWAGLGVYSESLRYYRILNRIEDAMRGYKA